MCANPVNGPGEKGTEYERVFKARLQDWSKSLPTELRRAVRPIRGVFEPVELITLHLTRKPPFVRLPAEKPDAYYSIRVLTESLLDGPSTVLEIWNRDTERVMGVYRWDGGAYEAIDTFLWQAAYVHMRSVTHEGDWQPPEPEPPVITIGEVTAADFQPIEPTTENMRMLLGESWEPAPEAIEPPTPMGKPRDYKPRHHNRSLFNGVWTRHDQTGEGLDPETLAELDAELTMQTSLVTFSPRVEAEFDRMQSAAVFVTRNEIEMGRAHRARNPDARPGPLLFNFVRVGEPPTADELWDDYTQNLDNYEHDGDGWHLKD